MTYSAASLSSACVEYFEALSRRRGKTSSIQTLVLGRRIELVDGAFAGCVNVTGKCESFQEDRAYEVSDEGVGRAPSPKITANKHLWGLGVARGPQAERCPDARTTYIKFSVCSEEIL